MHTYSSGKSYLGEASTLVLVLYPWRVKSYSRAAAAFSEGALPGPPLLMATVERDLEKSMGSSQSGTGEICLTCT